MASCVVIKDDKLQHALPLTSFFAFNALRQKIILVQVSRRVNKAIAKLDPSRFVYLSIGKSLRSFSFFDTFSTFVISKLMS